MIPIPLLDGDTLLIDSSSTSDVMTCKRLAQYTFCLHKKPTGEKSALKAGGIAHKIMEYRYSTQGNPGYPQDSDMEAGMVAMAEKEYETWQPPEDDFRTFSNTVSMINAYGKAYPYEDFEVLKLSDGRPFIEVPFMRPFAELQVDSIFLVQSLKLTPTGIQADGQPYQKHITFLKIVWIGRIDMAYKTAFGTYIMDHKTSTMASNTGEFTLAHQMYGYVDAAQYLLDSPITGFVVNRIVWRKPTKTGTPFTFERVVNQVSPFLLAEWKQDCLHIIADLVESIRRGYMQKETTWCYGKFGQCPFHKVCTLDSNEQRDIVLQSGEFVTNSWSPLV